MKINFLTEEDLIPVKVKLERLAQIYSELMEKNKWIVYDNGKAAILLGVTKRTLQNWRDKGLIRYTQIGSKIYYTQEAIQQMLAENVKERLSGNK